MRGCTTVGKYLLPPPHHMSLPQEAHTCLTLWYWSWPWEFESLKYEQKWHEPLLFQGRSFENHCIVHPDLICLWQETSNILEDVPEAKLLPQNWRQFQQSQLWSCGKIWHETWARSKACRSEALGFRAVLLLQHSPACPDWSTVVIVVQYYLFILHVSEQNASVWAQPCRQSTKVESDGMESIPAWKKENRSSQCGQR